MTRYSPQIFISYATNDIQLPITWLKKLQRSLEEIGCIVIYYDKLKKENTIEFDSMMVEHISKCDFILPILTQRYYEQALISNSGVKKELLLIQKNILNSKNIHKLIIITKGTVNKRPHILDGVSDYDFTSQKKYYDSMKQLTDRIKKGSRYDSNSFITKNNMIDFLLKLNYVIANVPNSAFANKNTILLYPVVPRASINIIHKAQLEVLAFISKNLDWTVEVLISDFTKTQKPSSLATRFKSEIEKYLQKKKINNKITYSYSSTYFEVKTGKQNSNVEVEKLISIISLKKLTEIIVKNYPSKVRDSKMDKKLQIALRPVQTMAITCHLSMIRKKRIVVLAGRDEDTQWEILYSQNGKRDIGALLIPILELGTDETDHDELTKKNVYSVEQMKASFKKGNFLEWALQVFVALNPDKFDRELTRITAGYQIGRKPVKRNIDQDKLAKEVYELIKKE